MANETAYSGLSHPTDVYSAAISAALNKKVVAMPLIRSEDIPTNTKVKYVQKDGSVAASTGGVSEGANYTTLSAYTRTGVGMTAIKDVVCTKLPVESIDFGGVDEGKMVEEIAKALGREMDAEILALATGFSQLVTASNILTVDDVLDAGYAVDNGTEAATETPLIALLARKGGHQIRKELVRSGASVFSNESKLSILGGARTPANGYIGDLIGIRCFVTSGFATTGGDNRQMVIDPSLAIYGMYGAMPRVLPPIWVGQGTYSFAVEVSAYAWHAAVEWNDAAGCELRSDT